MISVSRSSRFLPSALSLAARKSSTSSGLVFLGLGFRELTPQSQPLAYFEPGDCDLGLGAGTRPSFHENHDVATTSQTRTHPFRGKEGEINKTRGERRGTPAGVDVVDRVLDNLDAGEQAVEGLGHHTLTGAAPSSNHYAAHGGVHGGDCAREGRGIRREARRERESGTAGGRGQETWSE